MKAVKPFLLYLWIKELILSKMHWWEYALQRRTSEKTICSINVLNCKRIQELHCYPYYYVAGVGSILPKEPVHYNASALKSNFECNHFCTNPIVGNSCGPESCHVVPFNDSCFPGLTIRSRCNWATICSACFLHKNKSSTQGYCLDLKLILFVNRWTETVSGK